MREEVGEWEELIAADDEDDKGFLLGNFKLIAALLLILDKGLKMVST